MFIKHYWNTKEFIYYITKFGALKIKEDESVIVLTTWFNKIYGKIPTKINLAKTSANLTYANSFDVDFPFLLRETRSPILANIKEAPLEVDSKLMEANKLRGKSQHLEGEKKE